MNFDFITYVPELYTSVGNIMYIYVYDAFYFSLERRVDRIEQSLVAVVGKIDTVLIKMRGSEDEGGKWM